MLRNVLRQLVRRRGAAPGRPGKPGDAAGPRTADDAEARLRAVLAAEPANVAAVLELASLLRARGALADETATLEKATRAGADDPETWYRLGIARGRRGESARACECLERAVALDPSRAGAWIALGNARQLAGGLDRALEAYDRALAIETASALTWHNYATLLRDRGELRGALVAYDRALALDPDLLDARFGRALALLGLGDLAEGWPAYEIRMRMPDHAANLRPHPQPRWNGEPLAGRALLVWGEQGVGDEIMLASAYPDLARLDGRVVFECQPKLVALFARSFPWARVVPWRERPDPEELGAIDLQTPAGSLGGILRSDLARFPPRRGHLLADPDRVRAWRQRLADLGPGLCVGMCWRSGDVSGKRALSCSELDDWADLLAVPGVNWICLQYDDCERELADARARHGAAIHRFSDVDYFDDLDEVAALTRALDLVVSAPTAVGILAAALGVETWQFSYGRYWQAHGTGAMPWLPAMVCHPRRWDLSWPELLCEMAPRLAARAAGGSTSADASPILRP